MSSPTTIQPNKEGPSTLEKINDAYGEAVEKLEEKIEDTFEQKP